MTSKDITQISVIAAILTILAALKIPSIIPGLDFQLSAPAALLILAFFGIKKYFLGGLLSSLLLLVFGVFNP
ncbi:TPA: QueT transporter family protein, partial [Staphylococcus aureus]|nr:QueT transporter family protein [Staphylococcus aureus]